MAHNAQQHSPQIHMSGLAKKSKDALSHKGVPSLPLWDWPVFAASLAANLLALALPIIVLQTYDRIIPNQSHSTLAVLGLGLGVAILMDMILRCCRSWITGWSGARFEHRLSEKAMAHLLHSSARDIEKTPPGAHLDRFNAIDKIRDFFASQGPMIAVDLPFAVLFLSLIWMIGGPIVWVPIGLFALFGAAAIITGALLRRALTRRSMSDDFRYNFLIEVLAGSHTIKALGMEPAMLRRYERLMDGAANTAYETALVSGINQGLSGMFGLVATLAIVMVGSIHVLDGAMTMGALSACMILGGRSLQPVLRALGIWTHFQQIRLGKESLKELYNLPTENTPSQPVPDKLAGDIQLKNVAFAYDDDAKIFTDLSLDVKAGETIAIRGPNGCGKTTLMSLINGMIKPDRGQVLIDGIDLELLDHTEIRSKIAYLPQKPTIYQGTVIDNLTMFQSGEAIDRALYFAAKLGLDEVFARLPDGLRTQLGKGSTDELSGGIRQRIAIVRALVGNKKVILFDEANSGLDLQSDDRLKDLLEELKGQHTLVMITYRPSLLRLADKVYDIAVGGATGPVSAEEAIQSFFNRQKPASKETEKSAETKPAGGAA